MEKNFGSRRARSVCDGTIFERSGNDRKSWRRGCGWCKSRRAFSRGISRGGVDCAVVKDFTRMNFDRWRNTEKERERVLLARSIYIYIYGAGIHNDNNNNNNNNRNKKINRK